MSDFKRVLLRIAGLCGIIAPIITISFIALAIACSPWFNWFKNALSDLGVHEAAILFNSSLMIGGVLAVIFAIGLMQILRQSRVGSLGTFVLILAAVSLFAIGLFPETAGRIHLYVSISFFVLAILSSFLIGVTLLRELSERRVGAFSILAGVFAVAVWTLPYKGVAIPEMLASLALAAWAIIMGIRLYKQAR